MGTPSAERVEVYDTIRKSGPITTYQIANRLLMTVGEVSKISQNLAQSGRIKLVSRKEGWVTTDEWSRRHGAVGFTRLTNANSNKGIYTGEELQSAVREGAMDFKSYPSLFGKDRVMPK